MKKGEKTANFAVDVIKGVLRNIFAKFESNACKIIWFRYMDSTRKKYSLLFLNRGLCNTMK